MLRIVDRIVEAFAVAAFVISSGFMFLNVINRYLLFLGHGKWFILAMFVTLMIVAFTPWTAPALL